MKLAVLTDDCQLVPPPALAKDKLPPPSVCKIWFAEPSAFGNLIPSKTNLPEPFGVNFKSMLVSPPVADISGAFPVAEFVTSIWFTADDVVWYVIC